ncbi:MAG: hypothetical protein K8S20_16010 [Chloroflexi bacterium]|nr:hypothetical protein [Chloroflexota bacterium]
MNLSPRGIKIFFACILAVGGILLGMLSPLKTGVYAQQPTGSIPTVTGTPEGAIVALYLDETHPQEDVYSGPSTYEYPKIGILLAGQEVPAYGYSRDRQWIQIYYPGVPGSVAWVYAPYVKIVRIGPMPLLDSPFTPTAMATEISNIDPTLVAAFNTPVAATRLPTFTAPAPLVIQLFTQNQASENKVPMGLLILGLGFVGALGAFISFLRGR